MPSRAHEGAAAAASAQPPFDSELLAPLEVVRASISAFTLETLQENREHILRATSGSPDLTAGGRIGVEDRFVGVRDGASDLRVTVLQRLQSTRVGLRPAIYFMHGGGMVAGDSRLGLETFLPYVLDLDVVVASVEYRLAPEHPDPAPVEDCYAGLTWLASNASTLNVDPLRIAIAGVSAGGGLAAGTALMARDRGFPHLSHQILMCPMLDDRRITPSSQMLQDAGPWTSRDNAFGWACLLGDRSGSEAVSYYAAPARAKNLSDLPRTYIDVGSAETFRDEALDYAARLSQAGVSVDFHLWGGGYHGFAFTGGTAGVASAANATRDDFVRRALGAS